MTKQDLVNAISVKTDVSASKAAEMVETAMSLIKASVASGESVYLRGFGTFKAVERKEKIARHITKDTSIVVPAHHTPTFKPSNLFKDEVKQNLG